MTSEHAEVFKYDNANCIVPPSFLLKVPGGSGSCPAVKLGSEYYTRALATSKYPYEDVKITKHDRKRIERTCDLFYAEIARKADEASGLLADEQTGGRDIIVERRFSKGRLVLTWRVVGSEPQRVAGVVMCDLEEYNGRVLVLTEKGAYEVSATSKFGRPELSLACVSPEVIWTRFTVDRSRDPPTLIEFRINRRGPCVLIRYADTFGTEMEVLYQTKAGNLPCKRSCFHAQIYGFGCSGIAVDGNGRIWIALGEEIMLYEPDFTTITRVPLELLAGNPFVMYGLEGEVLARFGQLSSDRHPWRRLTWTPPAQ